VIKEDEV